MRPIQRPMPFFSTDKVQRCAVIWSSCCIPTSFQNIGHDCFCIQLFRYSDVRAFIPPAEYRAKTAKNESCHCKLYPCDDQAFCTTAIIVTVNHKICATETNRIRTSILFLPSISFSVKSGYLIFVIDQVKKLFASIGIGLKSGVQRKNSPESA